MALLNVDPDYLSLGDTNHAEKNIRQDTMMSFLNSPEGNSVRESLLALPALRSRCIRFTKQARPGMRELSALQLRCRHGFNRCPPRYLSRPTELGSALRFLGASRKNDRLKSGYYIEIPLMSGFSSRSLKAYKRKAMKSSLLRETMEESEVCWRFIR